MTHEEYAALPGLSNSAMTDLAVSPLRYWHKWLNPEYVPEPPTPQMQFGSALHCAILEPSEFDKRYACELIPPEDCLVTIAELRAFLLNIGRRASGTLKADIIAQVQEAAPSAPILDVLQAQHAREHEGKVIFPAADWQRILGARDSLLSEPRVKAVLDGPGHAEECLIAQDKDTNVALKCRADWVTPDAIWDFKTFVQKRGASIDKSVTDAIFYERYYRQAYFYSLIRGWPQVQPDFILAFIEAEPPHEVRIRALRPKSGGQANLYWTRSMIEVRGLIATYKECMDHFGPERPWRYAAEVTPLEDSEIPQLGYS